MVKTTDNKDLKAFPEVDLDPYFDDLKIDFDLHEGDFQFSMPIGVEMVNDVITKPYSIKNFGHSSKYIINRS